MGGSTASLTIASASASDAGSYTVQVSKAYGSATSNAAIVTIVSPPPRLEFSSSLSGGVVLGQDAPVASGDVLTLTLFNPVAGEADPEVWDVLTPAGGKLTLTAVDGSTKQWTFTVLRPRFSNSTMTARYQRSQLRAYVRVFLPPLITAQPGAQTVGAGGAVSLTLSVTAEGADPLQ